MKNTQHAKSQRLLFYVEGRTNTRISTYTREVEEGLNLLKTSHNQCSKMDGSREGEGGPDSPPEKAQKYRVSRQ